ncbi:HNH endonuclease [Erwinia mallotivora]|uniref:HNH endonuclease n=1 Tax=Erwinia mallotivora TaxID=69222 RepID=UPI0021C1284F|nr:HNH endonuclease [Erwinia mallotivora]
MIRLNFPQLDCAKSYSLCVESISVKKNAYKIKMAYIEADINVKWREFERALITKRIHLINFCPIGRKQQLIIGNVTKLELMDFYTKHMCIKNKSNARKLYDMLCSSAENEICPLCGINGVATLDHYLPKARYPALSVNPKNLIPACENCNKGKSADLFLSESKRTLYPYHDEDKFYTTDWIFSEVIIMETLVFRFYTQPPMNWSQIERERVANHFEGFNLSKKYTINSAQFISSIVYTIRDLLSKGSYKEVREHFQSLANSSQVNSTLRAMYSAIASNTSVCRGEF